MTPRGRSTLHGGFPDDSRTGLLAEMGELFGAEAAIEKVTDFPGFSTDPEDPALAPLLDILTDRLGHRPSATGASYFTDASALVPAFGQVPTVVLGPGELDQRRRTDEFCFVERIEEAFDIHDELIRRMCR